MRLETRRPEIDQLDVRRSQTDQKQSLVIPIITYMSSGDGGDGDGDDEVTVVMIVMTVVMVIMPVDL